MIKEDLQKLLEDNKTGKGRYFFYEKVKKFISGIPDAPEQAKSGTRSSAQNRASHQWFKDVAKTCLECGVTVPAILRATPQLQVDEAFIKYLFRRIGQKKYGKKSTSEHNKSEIDPIVEEMVKFFATQVDPPMELPPFPSNETKFWQEQAEAMEYKTGHTPQNYEYPENDLGEVKF